MCPMRHLVIDRIVPYPGQTLLAGEIIMWLTYVAHVIVPVNCNLRLQLSGLTCR